MGFFIFSIYTLKLHKLEKTKRLNKFKIRNKSLAKLCSKWYNSRSVRRMRVERRFLMIEKDYSHHFELVSNYEPAGDQPKAIQELTEGVKKNKKAQILLGATGTGKTYTVSNVIQNVNKPTLIIAHNKTLDRKSTRLNSSHVSISYAVFCLKKKNTK